jgi:hypothetical protein
MQNLFLGNPTNQRRESLLSPRRSSCHAELWAPWLWACGKKKFLSLNKKNVRYVQSFTGLLCIIVFSVTFFPWLSPFFYSVVIKSSFITHPHI